MGDNAFAFLGGNDRLKDEPAWDFQLGLAETRFELSDD